MRDAKRGKESRDAQRRKKPTRRRQRGQKGTLATATETATAKEGRRTGRKKGRTVCEGAVLVLLDVKVLLLTLLREADARGEIRLGMRGAEGHREQHEHQQEARSEFRRLWHCVLCVVLRVLCCVT